MVQLQLGVVWDLYVLLPLMLAIGSREPESLLSASFHNSRDNPVTIPHYSSFILYRSILLAIRYVALADLKLPIWSSKLSNFQTSSCLCLSSAEITCVDQHSGLTFPCLFKPAYQDSGLQARWYLFAFNSTCHVGNAF